MAERSYFSLRYAIPGYTFLLLFIVINYRVILPFPKFFDFLIALSGSAIGFPITQTWFLWRRLRNTFYNTIRNAIATFSNRYNIIANPTEEQKKVIVVAYSYVIDVVGERHRNLREYLDRRFDLFNTFGATIVSILWGLSLGWIIRLIAAFFLEKPFHFQELIKKSDLNCGLLNYTEFWVLVLTTIFGIAAILLLCGSKKHVMEQYDLMARALIEIGYKCGIVKQEDLMDMFPDIFHVKCKDSEDYTETIKVNLSF